MSGPGRGFTDERVIPAPESPAKASKNPPARRFWHQGFLVQIVDGVGRVPFVREATAARVAAQATRHTQIPMIVEQADGYWYYTPAADAFAPEEAPDATSTD